MSFKYQELKTKQKPQDLTYAEGTLKSSFVLSSTISRDAHLRPLITEGGKKQLGWRIFLGPTLLENTKHPLPLRSNFLSVH